MKRIALVISFFVLFCTLRAQDTIYPFNEDYPFFKDSSFRLEDTGGWEMYYLIPSAIRGFEQRNVQAVVSGLAIPYHFGTRSPIPSPTRRDTISIRGAIIQIVDSDYSNPIIHLTEPLIWDYNETPHVRPYDCYLAYRSSTECGGMDTVMEAYSLYFNHPVAVSGNVFVGYVRSIGDPDAFSNVDEGMFCPSRNYISEKCYPQYPLMLLEYWFYENGTFTWLGLVQTFYFPIICPILSIPDTDSFSCPEVEGLAFAGMNAGYPTLMWDTAGEHSLYQLAYGPYDAPLDSLRVVESRERFVELFDRTLSDDIYYQARLRARCHHRCPVHDTVMWTAWSEPVFFYTGDSMPDTTHQQPIGIAPVGTGVPFAIVPNPAAVGRMPDVVIDPGVAMQGLTLTLHDGAGREVLHMAVRSHRFALPVGGLPAGVYTATLASPRGVTTLRMVIE